MSAAPSAAQLRQHAFGKATSELIEIWLEQIAEIDMARGLQIMRALQAGAFITVTASVSPLTRAQSAVMTMTDAKGAITPLCTLDFDTPSGAPGAAMSQPPKDRTP